MGHWINIAWILMAGFLVALMQAGFALVETGLCRAKNAAHTAGMTLMVWALGCLAFWAYGFAIGWGNWIHGCIGPGWHNVMGPGGTALNRGLGILGDGSGGFKYGLIGTRGFGLSGVDDLGVMALFFFTMVLMNIAATIPTGAMAERWSWKNLLLYGIWAALPCCLLANWVWGGGWLAQMGRNWTLGHGAVDFAGSGVVHGMGGMMALAGATVLGPRIGKYVNGRPQAIPGHHVPMVLVGTLILAFGWLGFTSGWTPAGTDLSISLVVVNTVLAGAAGAVAAMGFMMLRGMKADPSLMCNGMLAGLVAISAGCAFVSNWAAVIIGGTAGVLVVLSVFFWDQRGIDDPVGAISIHGVNGLWGVMAVGVFANGRYGAGWNGVDGTVRGLLYGDASQLAAQGLEAIVLAAFGLAAAYTWFRISDRLAPIRVSRETELAGLDNPELGALGYPDFVLTTHGGETPGISRPPATAVDRVPAVSRIPK